MDHQHWQFPAAVTVFIVSLPFWFAMCNLVLNLLGYIP